jgi:lipopolysaccharide transport system ATP-binding protein
MGEVSKGEGRTVLFVSHNMGAIQSLCLNSIVLKNGFIDFYGNTSNAINNYLNESKDKSKCFYTNDKPKEASDILEVSILNEKNENTQQFRFDEIIKIQFVLKVHKEDLDAVLGFRIKDQLERNIFTSEVVVGDYFSGSDLIKIEAKIPSNFLVPNNYQVIIGFHKVNVQIIRYLDAELSFSIEETGTDFFKYAGNDYGCVFVNCEWS